MYHSHVKSLAMARNPSLAKVFMEGRADKAHKSSMQTVVLRLESLFLTLRTVRDDKNVKATPAIAKEIAKGSPLDAFLKSADEVIELLRDVRLAMSETFINHAVPKIVSGNGLVL